MSVHRNSIIYNMMIISTMVLRFTVLKKIARPVATLIPVIEFGITALLIVPKWQLNGLYVSLGIMSIFTVYIIALLCFNDKLYCSCGGIIELLSWKQHLVFNATFVGFAIWAISVLKHTRFENRRRLYQIATNKISIEL